MEFRQDALFSITQLETFLCGRLCPGNTNDYPLDVGVYVSLINDGGVLYLLAFGLFTVLAGMFSSLSGFLLLFSLMLTKIKLSYPLVWVLFTVLQLKNSSNKLDRVASKNPKYLERTDQIPFKMG